ncbi:hypothetical protein SAMN05877753_102344 [Bacillus oleivorans]|uniref:ABC transporter periplasmic binding protein yphF n=1 Tax=Bacillus oleivorans TaxID=1448271 RepID=A0A285CL74_9BACI|nr:hypothetical protein [Bacillus oleivorans]SNX68135.1 hypothetical protein SAMN05877753_102344 [Bacillus oleivorans]
MIRVISKLMGIIVLASFLSGCLYPDSERSQNQIPYIDQLESVQNAIDQFQADQGGLLPIKTKEGDTPIYQKYLVDFGKLVPKYMPEPPGNSFENGGVYQYVLVNVEKDPTVKVFDLRISEQINEIALKIRVNGYPPYKEALAYNVYSLDFSKIGYREAPTVKSPYTGIELPFVINGQGELFVDYRTDLYKALKEHSHHLNPGEDIRSILLDSSVFVPAYSLPYTIDANSDEPIFMTEE